MSGVVCLSELSEDIGLQDVVRSTLNDWERSPAINPAFVMNSHREVA